MLIVFMTGCNENSPNEITVTAEKTHRIVICVPAYKNFIKFYYQPIIRAIDLSYFENKNKHTPNFQKYLNFGKVKSIK